MTKHNNSENKEYDFPTSLDDGFSIEYKFLLYELFDCQPKDRSTEDEEINLLINDCF